ncbi:MAG: hypothetical protein ACFFDH_08965 [Promethearchaeota archaeon]
MKYKEKQAKYKPEILNLLKSKPYGLIATDIKEYLNHNLSRNTIQSYLEQLKAQKKVYSVKFSRYELWFHKNQEDKKRGTSQELSNHPIFPFLAILLDKLENSPINEVIDWKKFGFEIGKIFGFEPYFPELRYFVIDDPSKIFNFSKELYPLILRQILIFFGDKNFEIDPPIIQKEMNNFVFRIRGSKFCKNKIFFPLLCGIEEAEIDRFIPFLIKIDVLQQIPEEKIVDLNFKIFPNKK